MFFNCLLVLFLIFQAGCAQVSASASPTAAQDSISLPVQDTGSFEPYAVDTGDVLEISVWGYEELTREVTVRPDGRISYVLTGDITAKNLATAVLAKQIEEKISLYVNNPRVSVILKKAGDKVIFVSGCVKSPGSYPLFQGEGVMEAVSQAGGLTKEASSGIRIFRRNAAGAPPKVVDFNELVSSDDPGLNLRLFPGDVVYVPETDRTQGVFVFGQVNKPGLYELKNAPTLLALVVTAGGAGADATLAGIKVVRREAGKQVILFSNLDRALSGSDPGEDIGLKSGDIVYVPRSALGSMGYATSKILPPVQIIYYLNFIIKELLGLP